MARAQSTPDDFLPSIPGIRPVVLAIPESLRQDPTLRPAYEAALARHPSMAGLEHTVHDGLAAGEPLFLVPLILVLGEQEAVKLLQSVEDPAKVAFGAHDEVMRYLMVAHDGWDLEAIAGWCGPVLATELGAPLGAVPHLRRLERGTFAEDPEEVRTWMAAHPEQAVAALAVLASPQGTYRWGTEFRELILQAFEADPGRAASALVDAILSVGDPTGHPEGEPAPTLRWLAARFGEEHFIASARAEEQAVLARHLDPVRSAVLRDGAPGKKIAKWWAECVAPLSEAGQSVASSSLDPRHPACVALREAEPEPCERAAASLLTTFLQDKSKPAYRHALAAALRLAPEASIAWIGPQALRWARSTNRNHRTTAQHAIRWLGELARLDDDVGDRALSWLSLLAEAIPSAKGGGHARRALEWVAVTRGVGLDQLVAGHLPDIGLEPDGSTTVDYGERRFDVRFTPRGDAIVRLAGRAYKSVPKPGKRDNPDVATAAYEAYRELRDVVKLLLGAEARRLEAQLRTQRTWPWAALSRELLHPIRRLVSEGIVYLDAEGQTFRMDHEGPVDLDDEPMTPRGDVRLAHPLDLGEVTRIAWADHLVDYELLPVIDQLGREVFRVAGPEIELVAGWNLSPGGVMGLLRSGWSDTYGSGEGLSRPLAGGTARLWLSMSFRGEAVVDLPPLPVRALVIEGRSTAVERSELVRDLARIRAGSTVR